MLAPILLVEDCVEDVEALSRTLRKLGVAQPLTRCETAEEALDYLHHRGAYGEAVRTPSPALILLDLNLPGLDGRDLLGELKGDPLLQAIPVVILTSSANPEDVAFCYRRGASGFLVKPMGLRDLEETVRSMIDYWFGSHLLLPGPPSAT